MESITDSSNFYSLRQSFFWRFFRLHRHCYNRTVAETEASLDDLTEIKNELTGRALFAVPVSGNSMEPTYHDGDILLVEKTEELQEREIGIFTLDCEGYVKKLGDGELISLNPDYALIPTNESILLNGKVIDFLEDEWIVER